MMNDFTRHITNVSFLFLALSAPLSFLEAQPNHVELGAVTWLRDFDEATAQAQKTAKPILLLFQEVPGCMTCRNYGSKVLSHPFIVEAVEDYFVPLAIFNNRKGRDAQILEQYGEPSWNNPVVRFTDQAGHDLIDRLNGNYRPTGLIEHMMAAMQKSSIAVPEYLKLAHAELKMEEGGLDKVTFSMFCFWTGEKVYGQVDGVAYTEAGFMDGHEVVNVYFDPSKTSVADLIEAGKKGASADGIYCSAPVHEKAASALLSERAIHQAGQFRLDREPQYYLSKSKYRSIPMSRLQRTKVNALLGNGQNPEHLLSPRQLKMLQSPGQEVKYSRDDWMQLLLAVD